MALAITIKQTMNHLTNLPKLPSLPTVFMQFNHLIEYEALQTSNQQIWACLTFKGKQSHLINDVNTPNTQTKQPIYLNHALIEALNQYLTWIETQPFIGLILRADDGFCTGLCPSWQNLNTLEQLTTWQSFSTLKQQLQNYSKVIIASMDGAIDNWVLECMLHAHIGILTEQTSFSFAGFSHQQRIAVMQADLNNCHTDLIAKANLNQNLNQKTIHVMQQLQSLYDETFLTLQQRIGKSHALDLLLTHKRITAYEAINLNLFSYVTEQQQLNQETLSLIERIVPIF